MAFKHQWSDVEKFVLQAFEGKLAKDFNFKGYVHSSPWHRTPRMVEEFGKVTVILVCENGSASIHYMGEMIHDYHETGSVSFNHSRIVVGMSIGFRFRATARRLKIYTDCDLPIASSELTVQKVSFSNDLRMKGNKAAFQFVDKLIE